MFKQQFYHGTLRKYVTLFGTLFNDIYINRTSPATGITTTVKVPLAYGPKEKGEQRLLNNPDLDASVGINVPRMGFEITTLSYSPTRKLATITRNRNTQTGTSQVAYQYSPVPYDISFSLYITCKYQDEGAQILEQILPYFTPERTTTVNLIPEMNHVVDIPLTLINVTPSDTYEGGYEERRSITWTLDFLMKGYFYGPVKKGGPITLANINFFDASPYATVDDAVGVATPPDIIKFAPGMTANGQPTSNGSISVAPNLINANNTYGIIITRG